MLNDLRRFSTNAFPEELRQSAWAEVLEKVLMGNGTPGHALPPLDGHVSSCSSALDSVFVKLSSSPQVLVPHTGNAHRYGNAVLVVSLLAGSGLVIEGD
jgi:hypothetical protein